MIVAAKSGQLHTVRKLLDERVSTVDDRDEVKCVCVCVCVCAHVVMRACVPVPLLVELVSVVTMQ